MKTRRASVTVVVLVLVLAFSGGLVPAQAYEGGGATPEELIERFKAAAAKEDLAGVAACLSPAGRAELSFGLILGAGMMAAMGGMAATMGEGFAEAMGEEMPEGEKSEASAEMEAVRKKSEEQVARLETILTKYGVADLMEEEGPMPSMEGGGPSEEAMAAVLADVDQIGLIGELGALLKELGNGESEGGAMPEGDLEDLKVEGDRGTGTLGGQPIEFLRIDGRWFLQQPKAEPAG